MFVSRLQVWWVMLALALLLSLGWIFLPGQCVVQPVGTSEIFLKGSVFSTFLHPFTADWVFALNVMLKVSPVALVLLAIVHWRRRFYAGVRAVTALYTLGLAAAVALHPYRAFSDIELIIIVSIWGILVLVAYESKASPGSALLALMSVQLGISEMYSGLGVYRGTPFWILIVCLSIIFTYGIFHYTRTLRHAVLGRYTEITKLDRKTMAKLRSLGQNLQ